MDSQGVEAKVLNALSAAGFDGRVVPARHVREIGIEVGNLLAERHVDATFYSERLTGFEFDISGPLKGIKSIIITAAPQPLVRVHFTYRGRKIETFVPPTYSYDTDEKARSVIEGALKRSGHRLMDCNLPVKTIAVRSGLAKYGRNNITFTDKFGSFFRLRAFYSDLDPSADDWGEMKMAERCERCTACVKTCRTGAIDGERFLIHAEKCITFHNERSCSFPDWIEPGWHNCLIGCMDCQLVCPLNKGKIRVTEPIAFDETETHGILDGTPEDEISNFARMKISGLNLLDDYGLLARNLRVLIKQTRRDGGKGKLENINRSLRLPRGGI